MNIEEVKTKLDYVKFLEEYIDLEKLANLTEKNFLELKNYFDDNQVYKRLDLGESKIVCKKDLFDFIGVCKSYLGLGKVTEYANLDIKQKEKNKELTYSQELDRTIFFYFLLLENDIIKKNIDNEDFFSCLREIYFYNPEDLYDTNKMHEKKTFVLFCTLIWKKDSKMLVKYIDEFDNTRGDLLKIIESEDDIKTVGDFINRVDELADPDSEETKDYYDTRMSVDLAIENANTIIDLIEKKKAISMPGDEGFIEFCKNNPEYNRILQMVLNTKQRRNWYLYRVIQFIIKEQIRQVSESSKDIVEAAKRLNSYEKSNKGMRLLNASIDDEKNKGYKFDEYLFFENNFNVEIGDTVENEEDEIKKEEEENIEDKNTEKKKEKKKKGKRLYTEQGLRESFDSINSYIMTECVLNLNEIYRIFSIVFDDTVLHAEDEEDDTVFVSDIDDSFVKRCISRGMDKEEISKIIETTGILKLKKGESYDEIIQSAIDELKNDFRKYVIDNTGGDAKFNKTKTYFIEFLTGEREVTYHIIMSFVLLGMTYYDGNKNKTELTKLLDVDYLKDHLAINARYSDEHFDMQKSFNKGFYELYDDFFVNNDNMLEKMSKIAEKYEQVELGYLREGKNFFEEMFGEKLHDRTK